MYGEREWRDPGVQPALLPARNELQLVHRHPANASRLQQRMSIVITGGNQQQ